MNGIKPVIVVIEDDPQICRFLRTSLSVQGFQVNEAETGERGVIEIGSRKPELVILDLGLPGMDGIAVIRKVREWSAVPIIVLSAGSRESNKIAALDAGADDYLTKPFSIGELLARIRVSLRHAVQLAGDGVETRRFAGRFIPSQCAYRRPGNPSDPDRIPAADRVDSACGQGADASAVIAGCLGPCLRGACPLCADLHGAIAPEA
jgi:DNA-binding response OmpR family regulator